MYKKKLYCDVMVAGGGMSGVVSAIAASREGAKVILIEKGNCLGGTATEGMLGEINGAYLKGESAIPHIGEEIIKRLIDMGAGQIQGAVPMTSNPSIKVDRVRYNSEYLKLILDEMVREAGIKTLFCANIQAITESEDGIQMILSNRHEEIDIHGRMLVDSTGNSDCIHMLGAETIITRKEDKQAVSIIFRLGGIDIEAFETLNVEETQDIIKQGIDDTVLPGRILSMFRTPGTKEITVNCTRKTNIDNEHVEDVSEALMDIREQIKKIIPFIRKYVRGCENAYLSNIASALGIRDRRRIDGIYEISNEDILHCIRFEDSIAIGVYPIDIHKGPPYGGVEFKEILGNGIYKIPYRSLIPKTLNYVLANGKCIAADDIAFGAIRAMGPLMNIAAASGVAAAMAAKDHIPARDVSVSKLQVCLKHIGVRDL